MNDGGHVTLWPEDDWQRFEMWGISGMYDLENTPRLLAVHPDEGASIGGVRTTITFDIGIEKDHNATGLTVERINLAGVECTDLGVPRTISSYRGKPTVAGLAQPVTTRGTIFQVDCTSGAYNGGRVDILATGVGLVYLLTNHGAAASSSDAKYQYVDYWSAPTTWEDGKLPGEGDSVFIYAGRNIVLDISPPTQNLIWVQGRLSFARKDIELHAHYIVVQNGTFEIGTEERPFEHHARVVLHGTPTSTDLPIYGSKVIACRFCTLDLHGRPRVRTWTRISQTVFGPDSPLQF